MEEAASGAVWQDCEREASEPRVRLSGRRARPRDRARRSATGLVRVGSLGLGGRGK
jgi:hypothetical protein